jgi:rhodanese-related sulfurtransferase
MSCSHLLQKAFLQKWTKNTLSKKWKIYDIRTIDEYEEYHIPYATHITNLSILAKEISKHPTHCKCIVCRYGSRSYDFISTQKHLSNIYSLEGGMIERSANHYPKESKKICPLSL